MTTHSIGIDFGTSKTLVSYRLPQTPVPQLVNLGQETPYMPTTAYVDVNGKFYFGDEAEYMLDSGLGVYLRGFKMQLGTTNPVTTCIANGKLISITAKELVRQYLQYIRTKVEDLVYHGEKITSATITRPVNFSPAQCTELKQAAQEAGFSQVTFTTEPEAAGLAFCRLNVSNAFRRSALIVDWGGGTLDFALVTRDGSSIRTHSNLTDGDTSMGGEKFDEKLWTHVSQALEVSLNHTTQLPKVRRAKERLSTQESFPLRLSSETGACPPLTITRNDFNKLISADINTAVQKVQVLLKRIPSEYKPEILLLVGGSSRIPLIKEKLEAVCKLPAISWDKSRDAVALGAALWGKFDEIQPAPTPKPQKQSASTPKPAAPKPKEDYWEKGFTAINYCRYEEAYNAFSEGHKKGDLACTAMLAWCHRDGTGTPIDFLEYIKLAKSLEVEQCPLAFALLAHAYSEGHGCKIDVTKAEAYALRWAKESAAPIHGVTDNCRLFFRSVELEDSAIGRTWLAQQEESKGNIPSPIDFDKARAEWSRQYKGVGMFTYQVSSWLHYNDDTKKLPPQLLTGLEKESHLATAKIVLARVLANLNQDKYAEKIKQLVKEAARTVGNPDIALNAVKCSDTEEEADEFLDIFWRTQQYGMSLKKQSNLLPCELKLTKPDSAGLIRVYNIQVADKLINENKFADTVSINYLPALELQNTSNATLSGLTLRVVLPGSGEHTFPIKESIAPKDSVKLNLVDYDINWQLNFWLEVSDSSGHIARLFPTTDCVQLCIPELPPILACWDKNFWGDMILKLGSLSGTLTNVRLHKADGSISNSFTLNENSDLQSIGKSEMSDYCYLEADTLYAITCDQADTVLCCLLTSDGDSSAGWKSAAKWALGIGSAVLLGS